MKIYKYKLSVDDVQTFMMPKGYEILTVQTQNGDPYIWAKVDPDKEKEAVIIDMFGTGDDFTEIEREYIGTFQLRQGNLVFHVFERM